MIHVKDDWYIDIDQYSYTLEQFVVTYVDKDGVERNSFKNQTYHATLEKALKHFSEEVIREKLSEEYMELKDAITVVRECRKSINEAVERLLNDIEEKDGEES